MAFQQHLPPRNAEVMGGGLAISAPTPNLAPDYLELCSSGLTLAAQHAGHLISGWWGLSEVYSIS